MERIAPERRDFIPYPTNRVVGTVADAKRARAAIESLLHARFERQDIDVLHGEEGVRRLAPTGEEHGFLAQFQRTLIRAGGVTEEYKHLTRHIEDVQAGRIVIMVLARQREQRMTAADILNDHGAEFVGFYGRWAWEGLASDAQGAVDSRARASHERNGVAGRPEHIPLLFTEAWNARDPDALAALFDQEAEFVNVTGSWWRGREAIRNGHAYGLERIFNDSTLTLDETTINRLREDVAVVHARMRLSGQPPIAQITQPGSRTTIFSFVTHRAGSRWLCASAHNTDVVPNMETNIVDGDGTFRAANYRSGHVS